MMKSKALGCLLLAISCSAVAQASKVRPVNLEQMAQRADRIFSGRCIQAKTQHDEALGRDVSVVVFEVQRAVKGQIGSTISVRMLAGAHSTGTAGFADGEEVVVFLYGDSSLGLTSPVGLGQGKFKIQRDKLGQRLAVPQWGTDQLFRGLSDSARARLGPAVDAWKGQRGVDPDALLDMAATLSIAE